MNQIPMWRLELISIIVGGSLFLTLGIFSGYTLELLLSGAALYLGWNLFQLHRLTLWISRPKYFPQPFKIGIWRDILNEIDKLQERGRKRKRKLSRFLKGFRESSSALPDATVVLDSSGNIEWWNSVASNMLGLEKERDTGRLIDDLIQDPLFSSYLSEGDYLMPLQLQAPVDADISLEVRIVPYGKGKRLLQARDITRLQQLETVRRDFVANVSHEMRTPLTVIHGYLETMKDFQDEGLAAWDNVIDQMLQQSNRMQSIIEDLLMLSSLETDKERESLDEVDIYLLLNQILNDAIELSGSQAHIVTLDAKPDVVIMGSFSELESAFANLVYNAVRYTPAGGKIEMCWRDEERESCFSVRDTGIGIEAKHIPRLTERFYRVDVGRSRQSGGTGLGLAIVKHILSKYGAYLRVESKPGMGSTFSCCFPASKIVRPD